LDAPCVAVRMALLLPIRPQPSAARQSSHSFSTFPVFQ
jgi:hypothetical protein